MKNISHTYHSHIMSHFTQTCLLVTFEIQMEGNVKSQDTFFFPRLCNHCFRNVYDFYNIRVSAFCLGITSILTVGVVTKDLCTKSEQITDFFFYLSSPEVTMVRKNFPRQHEKETSRETSLILSLVTPDTVVINNFSSTV